MQTDRDELLKLKCHIHNAIAKAERMAAAMRLGEREAGPKYKAEFRAAVVRQEAIAEAMRRILAEVSSSESS